MPIKLPSWTTDVAIIILIFTVGGYVARLEYGISEIKTAISNLEKESIAMETAISIHHGRDWSEKVENKTLKRVDDLESTIGDVSKQFDGKISKLNVSFCSTDVSLSDLKAQITAVHNWTKQGDGLIRRSRLEAFRALAVFSKAKVDDEKRIWINKQHSKGRNFKKGDSVLLENPMPPGLQVEVTVEGFLDDPKCSDILVQINEKLIEQLGLTKELGQFELFIQGKPEALRWKTLEELYTIAKSKEP